MNNIDRDNLINEYYSKAVSGITESTLNEFGSWNTYCQALPEKEHITYVISLLDWQVRNGGFHQYFFNAYGMFCFYSLDSLKRIGCVTHADILNRAINVIYDMPIAKLEFSRLVFERKVGKISDFDEQTLSRLNVLDEEYYKLIDGGELLYKLSDYLGS